jgi:hypothetical protein
MQSTQRSAVLAVLVVLAFAAPAGAADPILQPGTYGQYNPGTKKVAVPGNQVVFVRGKDGKLSFSLNAIRGVDLNQGYVVGTLPAGGRTVTWTQHGEGINCKLIFNATATGLTIMQDLKFGDCGFGYGVVGDGQYVKVSNSTKLGAPPGP